MKKLILSIALFTFSYVSNAQTKVFIDESGNYVAMAKPVNDTSKTTYKETGRFFIEKSGAKLPVYISDKGKEFVFVVSKKGNKYRKYLTVSK
jgi:hypothetical protein